MEIIIYIIGIIVVVLFIESAIEAHKKNVEDKKSKENNKDKK